MNRSLEISNLVVTKEEDEGPFRIVHVRSIQPVAATCRLDCHLRKNGMATRDINDVPHYGQPTILRFHEQRFACGGCDRGEGQPTGNNGIYERVAFVPDGFWITNRCLEWMARECVRRSFAEVARSVGLDPKTAAKAFKVRSDEVALTRRIEVPRVLGIDEIWLQDDYRAVLGDIENRRPMDMLLDRADTLDRYLQELASETRVEIVVTDRFDAYRKMIRNRMRNRLHVTDRWHVVKYANDALDVIRSGIAKRMPNRRQGASLRMAKGLFHTRWHDTSAQEREVLLRWFRQEPILKDAYWTKENYFNLYLCDSPRHAEQEYIRWQTYLHPDIAGPFAALCTIKPRWMRAYLAYFEAPYTTGYIESVNRFIADQDRDGRGYSFEVMRAKFLLHEPLVGLTYRPKVHVNAPAPRARRKGDLGANAAEQQFWRMRLNPRSLEDVVSRWEEPIIVPPVRLPAWNQRRIKAAQPRLLSTFLS